MNYERERLLVATFFNLRHDGEVGPMFNLIIEKILTQFKRIVVKEYVRGLLAHELKGKSYLDTLKIKHSTWVELALLSLISILIGFLRWNNGSNWSVGCNFICNFGPMQQIIC